MATVLELYKYKQSNRETKFTPKKGKFWCKKCDVVLVNEWKKCPICGARNGLHNYKKVT